MERVFAFIRRVTVEQWAAIDDEFEDPRRPSSEAAWVLCIVTVALIIERYWGTDGGGLKAPAHARALMEFIPYSSLRPRAYWGLFKLVTGLLIPYLCIKLVLRSTLRDHGFTLRAKHRGWRMSGLVLLAILPVVVLASFSPQFQHTYPRYAGAGRSMGHLTLWFAIYGLQFVLLEFFYRGFMLFALARHFGSSAIFVMVVPYAMIHFGKPATETFASIVAGIALGTLVLRHKTIGGGILIHCGVAFSMDLLALWHSGHLSRLWG